MPITAVRTVSEDDRWHVIEGLAVPFGGPFNGRDTYGTYFSRNTDLGLATRSDVGIPIPLWYHHGLDPDFRFDTIGSATPVRTDEDGVWVQAQIDKRHRYYETRVLPLLAANSLGLSGGSSEHSQRIAARTGEVLSYPIHEISLTPTEANPNAVIAVRTDVERIVQAFAAANGTETAATPDDEARRAAFRAWCEAAYDASQGAALLGQWLSLMGDEADEADQLAVMQRAADAMSEWVALERAEIVSPEPSDIVDALTGLANLASQTAADLAVVDVAIPAAIASYIEPAIRAGKRNSKADQDRITSIGEHASAISDHVTALNTSDSQSDAPGDDDAAARSADAAAQPAGGFLAAVRDHALDPYDALKSVAEEAGRGRALELLQRH